MKSGLHREHSDGTYYFTASVPAYDGIVLRRAKSLAELPDAEEVEIWHMHEEGAMSCHIWAPELHYLDGCWYIYYAGGDKDDVWNIRPYVLECKDEDPVTGTWTELGKMKRTDEDEFSFEEMMPEIPMVNNDILTTPVMNSDLFFPEVEESVTKKLVA